MRSVSQKYSVGIGACYNQLLADEILFIYKGVATECLLDTLVATTDERLTGIKPAMKIRRKISSITVEVLQNIYHHFVRVKSKEKEKDIPITFVLAKEKRHYTIIAGNYIATDQIDTLTQKIDRTNCLSYEQLKSVYREKLNNGRFSKKGGAGLGILDIARKSGQKIHYNINFLKPDCAFFSIKVKVAI